MTTWGHALWWRGVLWQIRWQGAAKQYLQAGEVVPPWKSLSHIKSWMVWRGNFMKTWFEGGKMIREWFEGATSWKYRMAGQDYSRTVWRGNIMKIWIEGAKLFPNGLKGQNYHERHLLAITSVLFHRPAGLSFASFCQTKLFSKLLLNQKKEIKQQLCWTQHWQNYHSDNSNPEWLLWH